MARLINIDNGGTLTDVWVMDGDRSFHTKTLTTPYDLSSCFFEGLKKASTLLYGQEDLPTLLQTTDHIRYPTTQGTNALVMKKGPAIGLISNVSLPEDLAFESDHEQQMFDSIVGDRVALLGAALEDPDYQNVLTEAVNGLSFGGAQRIVVSFCGDDQLSQERRFRSSYAKLFPRHMLGAVPVLYAGSLSSDRSFKRRSWTAIYNAFLHPSMEHFLFYAENHMRECRASNPLLIYRNDGYAGRVAKTVAVKTYSSGPRAGMESAREYARYYGLTHALTLDVGGTTSDIGLVTDMQVKTVKRGLMEGIPCSHPLTDIVSIGVGGGSVFRVMRESLQVGPESVGGSPGPGCFGLGGKEATITDALLVLGLLCPSTYFGGSMNIDPTLATEVIEQNVARPLGIKVMDAAHRMFDLWASSIAAGLLKVTNATDETALIAFGGGGPMGALAVAEKAGIRRVLIPRLSAVFSAHGIAFSDIAHRASCLLDNTSDSHVSQKVQELRSAVERNMQAEGFELDDCTCTLWWIGDESGPVEIPIGGALPDQCKTGAPVELEFTAVRAMERATLPTKRSLDVLEPVVKAHRTMRSSSDEQKPLPLVLIKDQKPGVAGQGPAVIEEPYWTCLVGENWSFSFTLNEDVLFQFIGDTQ
ncbi:MAG: hydantoinase/oxoprolinase family protein [Pseudomonadota bacterium]